MDHFELRLNNYNYDAGVFEKRVRHLMLRDQHLLGPIFQRSCMSRDLNGALQHVITRIDVLPMNTPVIPYQMFDYGTVLFSIEPLTFEQFLSRLSLLQDRIFEVAKDRIYSTSIGFSDRYEPSRNQYSESPCRVFEVSFGSPQLSHEPLLHSSLRSFSSPFDAIKEYLHFQRFNASSDGRLGRIVLCLPNLNAAISSLKIENGSLEIAIETSLPIETLKIDLNYQSDFQSGGSETILSTQTTSIPMAFVPDELSVWLIATSGFLADYHTENKHYSEGINPVLPKIKNRPAKHGESVLAALTYGGETEGASRRVFIIHGRDSAATEGLARYLEKLQLEPVVLQEQPNKGQTLIEKFEANCNASFAIALMTADDEGKLVKGDGKPLPRTRQNVLLEFGYFLRALGRNRVCALVQQGVEMPSDYHGVVYIPFDDSGGWKLDLLRELKASGLDVDANLAF